MKARTLDGANVNKYVRPTVVRLNKAKAFLAVEPLHNTRCHYPSPIILTNAFVTHNPGEQIRSSDVLGKKPCRARPSRQPGPFSTPRCDQLGFRISGVGEDRKKPSVLRPLGGGAY